MDQADACRCPRDHGRRDHPCYHLVVVHAGGRLAAQQQDQALYRDQGRGERDDGRGCSRARAQPVASSRNLVSLSPNDSYSIHCRRI
jgi:hypothetical protein